MILFLLFLFLFLYFAERYSLSHVLDRVSFKTSIDRVIVEPGEDFAWTLTVKNAKKSMVPYLSIRENVPEGLIFSETGETVEPRGLVSVTYLSGMQEYETTRRVHLSQRGRHFFRGVYAEAGDFLGIRTVSLSYQGLEEVVVKPKPYESSDLSDLLGGYLGDHAVMRSLFEDPIEIRGFREYTGREPFRSISWAQSAKLAKLMVKEQEKTVDLCVTILLNTDGGSPELLERAYSIVRSVCEELESRQISYDFYTNGVIAGAMGNWRQVAEGLGPAHLETVLEGLGRMTYDCRQNARSFVMSVARGAGTARSFIIVTPERSTAIEDVIPALEERSGRNALLLCADEMEDSDEHACA